MKRNEGITLIALIITIIIMLILVAVSVNILIKSNLIGTAEKTVNKYKTATEDEASGGKITINGKEYGSLDEFIKDEIPSDWDGTTTEMPEVKKNTETNAFDWYIYNEKQMKFLANYVNETLTEADNKFLADLNLTKEDIAITTDTVIYLMNDLNMGAKFDDNGNLTSGKQWVPIGPSINQQLVGTFEGNNHYICGIYINREEKSNGIFGNSNTVKNLTIKNSYLKGGNLTGGITGAVRGGTIENCHNVNTTVATQEGDTGSLGGIIGQSQADVIKNCTNSGKVINNGSRKTAQTGGIVGVSSDNTEISNCTNYGEIYSNENSGYFIGGICGAFMIKSNKEGTINNCVNNGKITCWGVAGGIVGANWIGTTIKNCSNTSEIKGLGGIGGIVGQLGAEDNGLQFSTVTECYNSGNIICIGTNEDSGKLGGIVGGIKKTGREDVISKCYNKGKIENCEESVGAILGFDSNTEKKVKLSSLYYLNTVGIGAIDGTDDEANKVQSVETDIKTYEEFIEWIKDK